MERENENVEVLDENGEHSAVIGRKASFYRKTRLYKV